MERITFDQLPDMVALILEKLERIEKMLATPVLAETRVFKEMLTVSEAAEFMGLSKSSLYKMSFNHDLPVYKPTGRRIYFKKEDLTTFLKKNRVMTNAEIQEQALNYVINNPIKRKANRTK